MCPALVASKPVGESRTATRSLAISCLSLCILFLPMDRTQAADEVPVFKITPVQSSIKFDVEASVAIKGVFDKWDATLTFTSPDATTGVLDIKIQADSVDTGSGMKDDKLKSKDFFYAERD